MSRGKSCSTDDPLDRNWCDCSIGFISIIILNQGLSDLNTSNGRWRYWHMQFTAKNIISSIRRKQAIQAVWKNIFIYKLYSINGSKCWYVCMVNIKDWVICIHYNYYTCRTWFYLPKLELKLSIKGAVNKWDELFLYGPLQWEEWCECITLFASTMKHYSAKSSAQ